MKLHRAITPLLLVTLAACAGPRAPWQGEDPGLEPVHAAYQTLMANYVDQPKPEVLLEAAFQGARQAVTDAGVSDPGVAAPSWTQGEDPNWERFAGVYNQLAGKYGKQVGSDKLEYAAIGAMAGALKDCQTRFYDPQATKDRRGDGSGQQNFGGIGVLMKNIPGHPTVLRVLDGPAKKAGLQPGDEIVAIDDASINGQSFEQVRNRIRGPQGSSVKLTIKRPGSQDAQEFSIGRAQIQAPIIDVGVAGNGTVGYIHLYSFPQAMPQEIDQTLKYFDEQHINSIVLDLRANTGGSQDTILAVLSRFVNGGVAEVQTDRGGNRQELKLDASQYWQNPKPLVLLADEDTQSGGEIFAKAMQEEGGYKIIGAPTAGCAASAKSFDMSDGSSLEISVAKVVSAKGEDINRAGVKPDQAIQFPVSDLAAGRDPQLLAAFQAVVSQSPQSAAQPQTAPNPPSIIKPATPAGVPANILK